MCPLENTVIKLLFLTKAWQELCVFGRIVFVGVVSDKVCINLVKIALAGGAAGGSS